MKIEDNVPSQVFRINGKVFVLEDLINEYFNGYDKEIIV